MPSIPLPRLGITLCAAALLLAFSGCSSPRPVHKKPAPAPTAVQTRAYMRNLTLAHMAFDMHPEDASAARPYTDQLARATSKAMPATVVMLSYTADGKKEEHTLMVPVAALAAGAYNFDALRQVIAQLAPRDAQYTHARVRSVSVPESTPLPKEADPADIRSKLDESYAAIAATAQRLPSLDAATLQLSLARFFMQQHIRDAAYITLENAKQRLAEVKATTPNETRNVERLDTELTQLETDLHKKMPYQF
ncbi:MAG: hypothetical protein V4735_06005 [Pseudomonadota bacterium]